MRKLLILLSAVAIAAIMTYADSILIAHAVQTNVNVTISAEVPCTVENRDHSITCLPEGIILATSTSREVERSWWGQFVDMLKSLVIH
jgi:hypothetical protein